jgi:CxxC motif-containing protein (DUF1111 family)
MKHSKILIVLLLATFAVFLVFDQIVNSQGQDLNPLTNQADKVSGTGYPVTATINRFGFNCGPGIDCEGVDPFSSDTFTFDGNENARPEGADQCPVVCPWPLMCPEPVCEDPPHAEDAPTGFDDQTNGLVDQDQHDKDRDTFEEVDDIAKGLGPVYNAQSCKECHQNPVTGAISQITELRAGHNDTGNNFVDAPGGSLINDRGIPTPNFNGNPNKSAKVQERVPPLFTAAIIPGGSEIAGEEPVRTFRTSLNVLGDGFVEILPNGTLLAISNAQSAISNGQIHGMTIAVPVSELNIPDNRDCKNFQDNRCHRRIGRFGWKDQIATLLSFSGDAYLNEIGITNFLIKDENTSLGRFVGFGSGFDLVPDNTPCDTPVAQCPNPAACPCGEDKARDIDAFTQFMQATKAPPEDKDIQHDSRFEADINAGRVLFTQMPGLSYSCSACHVPAILTSDARMDGPLNFKIIRPFSDFLLHDIGTGDGIVQNGGQPTRLMVRTPPLWGVRTRTRLMHDGSGMNAPSLTFKEAIMRHQGEAAAVTAAFQLLTDQQKKQLIMFLESL